MIGEVLKTAISGFFKAPRTVAGGARDHSGIEYPLEIEKKLFDLHGKAPVKSHLEILYRDVLIAGESFHELFSKCLDKTRTAVTPFNVFQRYQSRLDLVRYFMQSLSIEGARGECGVYKGATALLLAHVWKWQDSSFDGSDLFLIDSFSGSSQSGDDDLIAVRGASGDLARQAFFKEGEVEITPEIVRSSFWEFPAVNIHAGWIPAILNEVPEKTWSFVHLDLTLYEPTLASLEYFYPRMNNGGVIFCDGSIFCPGAERAWDRFCERERLTPVELGHRTRVLVK